MKTARPTVYDVAKQANVSIASVSFAFRRPDQISTATRDRVLKVAQDLGYIPSGSARGLARGSTGALGLHSFDFLLERPQDETTSDHHSTGALTIPLEDSFIPWEDSDDELTADPLAFPLYVDEVQRGFELECRANHRPVMISSGSDTTPSVADSAGRVDGLAIFPGTSAAASLAHAPLRIPIVLLSTPPADDGHHRVLADNDGGMSALIEHLLTAHGITDYAFVGRLIGADYQMRFDAYRRTLSEAGIATLSTVYDDTDLAAGRSYPVIAEAIRTGSLPRALICASDQIALQLLTFLTREGIRVPEDVVVTGFDGILAGQLSAPTLTTVRQPMEAMGRAAARILLEASTLESTAKPIIVTLGTKLVIRSSCGCSP